MKKLFSPRAAVPLVLLALVLIVFGDVLFSSGIVLSKEGTDLSLSGIYSREFGFGQLRSGNLALWNPHLFGGTPYLGNFHSALLYPPNCIYLFLPVGMASNLDIVLHLYLAGFFMALWARRRGLHPVACGVAACLVMFGSPYFLRIYAGHTVPLAVMAWIPLLFIALDSLVAKITLRACLVAVFAVTMQALAGHPQFVLYTLIAAVLYVLVLAGSWPQRARLVASGAAVYAGAFALAAVQLLTGLQNSANSAGSGAVSHEFAASFSLPPENFLTLIAPGFLGDLSGFDYWGRHYLWEVSLYIGVIGLCLALYGAFNGGSYSRRLLGVTVILLVLALGVYSPLFDVLYNYAPGFNKLRASGRLGVNAAVFLALLAGIGVNELLTSARHTRLAGALILAAGVLAGAAALGIQQSAALGINGAWGRFMAGIGTSGDSFLPPAIYQSPAVIGEAGAHAGDSLLIAGGICIVLAALIVGVGYQRRIAYAIAVAAVLEVLFFAVTNRATFEMDAARPQTMQKFLAEHPGDYRILNGYYKLTEAEHRKIERGGSQFFFANSAMASGAQDMWGYDPRQISNRYAEFMRFTQGATQNGDINELQITRLHRLHDMLRLRYVFTPDEDKTKARLIERPTPLPQLLLIHDVKVVTGRDNIFQALSAPAFDPRQTVILEGHPTPSPQKTAGNGTARVLQASTDTMEIEAEVASPAILLITDAYADGWHADALPGSVQQAYEIMPANYVLRAIPLMPGKHHLRLEYSPSGFRIGRWISLLSLLLYFGLWVWHWSTRGAKSLSETAL